MKISEIINELKQVYENYGELDIINLSELEYLLSFKDNNNDSDTDDSITKRTLKW